MNTVSQPVTSQQERSELILAHLPHVRWIAMQVRERLPRTVSLDDLISVGVLGLIAAIDRFDASQNVKLTTYADYRIRGSILDSIRSLDGVAAHKRAKLKSIHRAIASASQRLCTLPDEEQIANELGITVDEYHEWLFEVRPNSISSLDGSFTVGAHSVKLVDVLADESGLAPDQLVERAELHELVDRAFSRLPPAQNRVMQFYYRDGLRIHEIAGILGVHSSRIWQMKAKATARVREFIQEHWKLTRGHKTEVTSRQKGRYGAVAD